VRRGRFSLGSLFSLWIYVVMERIADWITEFPEVAES
jgi:hypothetical protein